MQKFKHALSRFRGTMACYIIEVSFAAGLQHGKICLFDFRFSPFPLKRFCIRQKFKHALSRFRGTIACYMEAVVLRHDYSLGKLVLLIFSFPPFPLKRFCIRQMLIMH